MPPRAEEIADFSGGIQTQPSPHMLPPNALRRGINVMFDQLGAVRTRDGFAAIDTLAPAGLTNHRAIGGLITASGLQGLVMEYDPAFNINRVYINNPWTLIGTMATAYILPEIIQFGNLAIFTDDYATPKLWTGSAFGTVAAGAGQTVPGGALFALSHLNQFWVWNTAAVRGTLDGPNSLRATDVNNINSWPNTFQVFLGDDSDHGMGLATFSIAETGIAPFPILVAFKGYSAYQITGTFGQSNFGIQQIRTDQGCAAPASIQFCPGVGIIRLTQNGFYLYDGLNDQCISTQISDYIFGGQGLTGIDLATNGYVARAALYPTQPPMYVCCCPVGGIMRRWFALDLAQKSWTVWDIPGPTGSGLSALKLFKGFVSQLDIGPATLALAFTGDKNLYQLHRSNTADAGSAIPVSVRLGPLPRKSVLRHGFYSRMLAKVYNVTQGQTVSASFAIGPGNNPVFVGGQQTVGQSAVATAQPGAALSSEMEIDLNYDIGRTGEVLHTDLAWNGPLTLRAVEWQGVPKPPTRPVRT